MRPEELNFPGHDAAAETPAGKTPGSPKPPKAANAELSDVEKNQFRDLKDEMNFVLDMTRYCLANGTDPAEVVDQLVQRLHRLRAAAPEKLWSLLVPLAQSHQLNNYLFQDPFTRRSFQKPRGYSGDGVLLDLLYQHEDAKALVAESTKLGQKIYEYTSISTSARAVQERRSILAHLADQAAERKSGAEVLAVASGHLREAELSEALANGEIKRWVAFDQDDANLSVVGKAYDSEVVKPVVGAIKHLISRNHDLGTFDLVYTAGVHDYLPFDIAVLLTRRMFEMLKPGGELLFGNFSTTVIPDGYMETFMNWKLLMRDEKQMWDIVNAATVGLDAEAQVFSGTNGHILYAKFKKRLG